MENQMIAFFLCICSLFSISCSNDDANNSEIIGTFQLTRFEDSSDGTILPPDDDRPIQLTFRADGGYQGDIGNNEIRNGNYNLDSNRLILKGGMTTEVNSTEWERIFWGNINKALEDGAFVMNFEINESQLILEYETGSKMFFIKL